jgi:hypothetical protein
MLAFGMRMPRCKLGLLSGLLAVVAALAWAPAAGAHGRVNTCAKFHTSALGPHEPWRAYKAGSVTSGAATAVLDAVLHGHGQVHEGSDSLNSYIIYYGVKCILETMGYQLCWRPTNSTPAHASAGIAAIDCNNIGGCPARYPADADPL